MVKAIGRRGIAAGAALLPAATVISRAHAESAPESTVARIQRTKVLRIAALPGQLPYFNKDIATGKWSGSCIEMANSIAQVFGARLDYLEATYGTSVLDLQTNKVDLAFALNPTPQRALSIGFTHPMIIHPFGCLTKHGLNPTKWDDVNKPGLRVSFDIGSLHETLSRRFAPQAQHVGFPNTDQAILALQTGRVDVVILAALLGLGAIGRNPSLGPWHLLSDPVIALPSCFGIQPQEQYGEFATVLNAWLDYNRGIGQVREWLIDGLAQEGVKREQIPASLTF